MKDHIPRVDFVILKTNHNKSMKYKNVINEFFGKERIFLDQRKSLIVLLGSFADFDSFEYCQQLSAQSKKLSKHSVDLILIGIGDEKSKESFCSSIRLILKMLLP